MDTPELLTHFNRLADAPGAIPRLRRLVLDLAVRGKLVAQDPGDEPASCALGRISLIRHELMDGMKSRTARSSSALSAKSPEALPAQWSTAKLSDLVRVLNGRAYKKTELLESGTPVLRVGNLFTSEHWYFSNLELEADKYCEEGDLLYAWSASFGPFIWTGPRVIFHYHIWKLDLFSAADLEKRYLYLYLLQKTREIKDASHGISMAHMTKEKMEQLTVPLPPLAEQHRIVAKVDELMGLLDQIEARQTAREATRRQLTTASLARLSTSDTSPDDFRDHARFLLDHLPAHTTRRDQIKQLRQTILNLAVRGRLVTENGEKTAAAVLSDHPDLPQTWRFVPLGEILAEDTRNGYSRRPDEAADGIPILRISAGTIRQDGIVAEEEHKLISGIDAATRVQYGLKKGDLLACRFNGNKSFVGRLTIFDDYFKINPIYPDKLIRVRLNAGIALPEFIRMAGDSDIVRTRIEQSCATTVGNWGISASNLKEIRFPLPLLAEQHRIVAKVNELMTLCDHLDAALDRAETNRSRLLDAELHAGLQETVACPRSETA